MPDPLSQLARFHSWQLHRVSPRTFPNDVACTLSRKRQPLSAKELDAIAVLIRTGQCYRCRIAKGRFFFGRTADEAVALAIKGEKRHAKVP